MKLKTILTTAALALAAVTAQGADKGYAHLYKGLQFEMPVVQAPVFPDLTVQLTDYNAVGDGVTLNTKAFADAFDDLSRRGGGTLNVPPGVWLTGPIVLRSNVNLHLEGGALIVFSGDPDLYGTVYVVYEGFEAWRTQSPISGCDLKNIAITGDGVIDGNGSLWRHVKKEKMNAAEWSRLVKGGGITEGNVWYPSQEYIDGMNLTQSNRRAMPGKEEAARIKRYLRPVMVQLVGCTDVLLQGVTFQNSPAWNVHPLMCTNLIVDDVYIKNPDYAQNGDGLDIESCKNVIVYRSMLDVGDDAICIKSGKDEAGRKRGILSENVIVRDCRVFHGHGGFVVGSEMSGGVRNVSVADCQFIGTDIGLRFKSTRGRGGVVENIYIDNVNMLDITGDAITFDLYYFTKNPPKEIPAVDETTPQFRDIFINGITSCRSGKAFTFNGLPEMPIKNIRVGNSVFSAHEGGLLSESADIVLDNVTVEAGSGASLRINNVNGCELRSCKLSGADPIEYTGSNSAVSVK